MMEARVDGARSGWAVRASACRPTGDRDQRHEVWITRHHSAQLSRSGSSFVGGDRGVVIRRRKAAIRLSPVINKTTVPVEMEGHALYHSVTARLLAIIIETMAKATRS